MASSVINPPKLSGTMRLTASSYIVANGDFTITNPKPGTVIIGVLNMQGMVFIHSSSYVAFNLNNMSVTSFTAGQSITVKNEKPYTGYYLIYEPY